MSKYPKATVLSGLWHLAPYKASLPMAVLVEEEVLQTIIDLLANVAL